MEVPTCKFITAAEDTLDNSSLSLFNDSLNSGSPRKPSEMLNDSLCIDEDDVCLFPTNNTLNPIADTTGLPSSSEDNNLPLLADETIQNPSQNSLTKVNVSESASSSQNSGSSSPVVSQNRITPMFGKRKLTKRPLSQNNLSDATKKLNNTTNTNNDMSDNGSECSQLATTEDHSTKENVNTNSGIINKPSFLKTKESKKKATMEKSLKLSEADKKTLCIEKPVKLNKKEKQERKELKEMEKKEKERIKAEKKLALEKKKAEREQKKMEKDLKKMERQKNIDEKKGKNENCTTAKSDVTSKEKGKVNEVTSNRIEDENDENVDNVCNEFDKEKDNDDSLHNDIAESTIKLLKDNESIDEVNDDLEEKDESISDELINRESSFNKDMSDNDNKLPLRGERDLEGSQKDECLTNEDGGCEDDDSSVESMSLSKSQGSLEEMQLEKATLPDSKSVDKSCVCITKTVKKQIFHKKPVFKIPKEKSSNKLPKDKRKRDTAASKQAKKFKSMSSSSCKPSSVWVQCDHPECLKWRLLRNVTDPTKLPDKWYCSMNEDTRYNCCKSNEESWSDPGDNMEFIYSPYNLGSIVLAKLEGYPWWPAMIDNDPDQNCYYESSFISSTPVRYHVVFFDKPVSRGWIHSLNIRPLTEEDSDYDEVPVKYKVSLAVAMKQVHKALCLTTVDRLDKYGFKTLYKRDQKRKFKFANDDGE